MRDLTVALRFLNEVWQDDFGDRLRIRFAQHHSKCSQCVRHRIILRRLGHCPAARRIQEACLQRHLTRQHRDRQCYWDVRSQSRLQANAPFVHLVSGILDSMDAQKHSWPRSRAMSAKEFSSFVRPRLCSTTLILHGHLINVNLSPYECTSNSSRSCELLAHGLSVLSRRLDVKNVVLHIQADNCSREMKNNTLFRAMGFWVATSKIKAGSLDFLSSGHSHEDIDAVFSLLRGWIHSHPEVHTPTQFQEVLQDWFAKEERRPYEQTYRKVNMVSQFRDWRLDTLSFCLLMKQFRSHLLAPSPLSQETVLFRAL